MLAYITADLSGFISNNLTTLNFSVNGSHQSSTQCYNISADFTVENLCDYYTDCSDYIQIESHLMKSNESDYVSILDDTITIDVQRPMRCSCPNPTPTPTLSSTPESATIISDGAIAGITVSVIIAVLTILSICLAVILFQKKTRKLDV